MSTLQFDASLRQRWRADGQRWQFEVPEGWLQGRSVFGGLTAAAAAGLALHQADPAWSLRHISLQLLRPLGSGPIEGGRTVLREGKNVQFVEIRLLQHGEVAVLASCTLAKPRESLVVVEGPRWEGPEPDSLRSLPYLPGIVPEFLQHLELRWASGAPPYTGAKDAHFRGYCRFRGGSGDAEGILGLLDAWPTPSLSLLRAPAPASTVSWSAHLLATPNPSDAWYGFDYRTIASRGGFDTIAGSLFAPSGELVAWTEQLVVVYA